LLKITFSVYNPKTKSKIIGVFPIENYLNSDNKNTIMYYANGTTTDRDAWLNNGTGWKVSTSWNSLEPFTKNGKNIGRRIGDVKSHK